MISIALVLIESREDQHFKFASSGGDDSEQGVASINLKLMGHWIELIALRGRDIGAAEKNDASGFLNEDDATTTRDGGRRGIDGDA